MASDDRRTNENAYFTRGPGPLDRVVPCDCCGIRFPRRETHAYLGRTVCGPCRDHAYIHGEDAERRERRLTEDNARIAEYAERMRQLLDRNEARLKEQREKVAAALSSRDMWEAQVRAVQKLHHLNDKGSCVCSRRPCDVMEAMERGRREGLSGDERPPRNYRSG